MKMTGLTEGQLAKALNGLLKEVSIEIGEMIGACLRDARKNPLASAADCKKFERCIEGHRDQAKSEKRQFAVAAADGLMEAVNRLRESLGEKRTRTPRSR
jgi:hypothetical protein